MRSFRDAPPVDPVLRLAGPGGSSYESVALAAAAPPAVVAAAAAGDM